MLNNDTLIVDADSHWCRAARPLHQASHRPRYKDRVPRVEEVDGAADVGVRRPRARPGSAPAAVIGRDGNEGERRPRAATSGRSTTVHVGAYDPKVRLEVLDECGIDAQVIFPSTIGLGGQDLGMVEDQDAVPHGGRDLQRPAWPRSRPTPGNRLLPDAAHAGVETSTRASPRPSGSPRSGMRGVNMTSDPQDLGAPDLAEPRVGPVLGGVQPSSQLPVHFHIGASVTGDDVLRQLPVGRRTR